MFRKKITQNTEDIACNLGIIQTDEKKSQVTSYLEASSIINKLEKEHLTKRGYDSISLQRLHNLLTGIVSTEMANELGTYQLMTSGKEEFDFYFDDRNGNYFHLVATRTPITRSSTRRTSTLKEDTVVSKLWSFDHYQLFIQKKEDFASDKQFLIAGTLNDAYSKSLLNEDIRDRLLRREPVYILKNYPLQVTFNIDGYKKTRKVVFSELFEEVLFTDDTIKPWIAEFTFVLEKLEEKVLLRKAEIQTKKLEEERLRKIALEEEKLRIENEFLTRETEYEKLFN